MNRKLLIPLIAILPLAGCSASISSKPTAITEPSMADVQIAAARYSLQSSPDTCAILDADYNHSVTAFVIDYEIGWNSEALAGQEIMPSTSKYVGDWLYHNC